MNVILQRFYLLKRNLFVVAVVAVVVTSAICTTAYGALQWTDRGWEEEDEVGCIEAIVMIKPVSCSHIAIVAVDMISHLLLMGLLMENIVWSFSRRGRPVHIHTSHNILSTISFSHSLTLSFVCSQYKFGSNTHRHTHKVKCALGPKLYWHEFKFDSIRLIGEEKSTINLVLIVMKLRRLNRWMACFILFVAHFHQFFFLSSTQFIFFRRFFFLSKKKLLQKGITKERCVVSDKCAYNFINFNSVDLNWFGIYTFALHYSHSVWGVWGLFNFSISKTFLPAIFESIVQNFENVRNADIFPFFVCYTQDDN